MKPSTDSYGYGARTATRNAWSHLVANAVDYSGHPALRPSGPPAAVQNRPGDFVCPSCGTRRMAESAALLVDEIFPHQPVRQLAPGMARRRAMQRSGVPEQLPRVLSFPFLLRFLFASRPVITGQMRDERTL